MRLHARIDHRLRAGLRRVGKERLSLRPYRVNLEVTNRCNSHCTMCNRFHERENEVQLSGFMSWGTVKKCEPLLRHATEANLSGFGEPLLHPEFGEIARYVKARVRRVFFYTNAIALDENAAKMLIETGVDQVNVSIGAADEATHRRIRGVALGPIVENLRRLRDMKRSAGAATPEVHFEVVAFRSAIADMENVVALARELDVCAISLPHLVVHGDLIEESPWMAPSEAEEMFERAACHARERGVLLNPPSFNESRGECLLPYSDFTVAWDGRVMSCHREAYVVGDLRSASAEEIWNGPEMRRLRRRIHDEGFEATCSGCTIWDHRGENFLHPREYSRSPEVS